MIGLLGLLAVPAATAQSILDDDLLLLRSEQRARLQVLDALERTEAETCGERTQSVASEKTRRALTRIIAMSYAECEAASKTQHRRFEVKCSASDEDIGAALAREGMARAVTDFRWRYILSDWLASIDGLGFQARHCETHLDKPAEARARSDAVK